MISPQRILLLALALPIVSHSFVVPTSTVGGTTALEASRRDIMGWIGAAVVSVPVSARADVWSGNELPQGVSQFNRCIRLKRDLKKVAKRVREGSAEMDKAEWENVSKFLRVVYTTANDDMKVVAAGIANADSKQRALADIDKLRTYAQAGDVPASKQDANGFLAVNDQMTILVDDFFSALVDVPDI